MARRRPYFIRPKPTLSDGTLPKPADDFVFDPDPAHARHVRAMQRVFREELERATFYRDRYGVPFEESELAGYRYVVLVDDLDA